MENFKAPETLKNKYQYVRGIGNGTFGLVCLYTLDSKYFAVKFFVKDRQYQGFTYEKVMLKEVLEANIHKACNLPEFIDDGSVDCNNEKVQFLIMQFIEYSIMNFLVQYPNKEEEIFIGMVNQLRELHKLGYIHKDIKPENYRVNRNGQIYFIDFGTVNKYDPKYAAVTQGRINNESSYTASKYVNDGAYAMQIDELIASLYSVIVIKDEDHITWRNNGYYSPLEIQEKIEMIKAKSNINENQFRDVICKDVVRMIKHLESIRENEEVEQCANPDYDLIIDQIKRAYIRKQEILNQGRNEGGGGGFLAVIASFFRRLFRW